MKRSLKWTAALLASGVLHAAAVALLLRETSDEVQIEGPAAMEMAVLGSFEDAFQADDPVEPVDTVAPVEEPSVAAEPVTTPETVAVATVSPPIAALVIL